MTERHSLSVNLQPTFAYSVYFIQVESYTIILLYLAYFTLHVVFKIHPYCSMFQNFVCLYIPHFVYPFICWVVSTYLL